MTVQEAKNYIQAALNALEKLDIHTSKSNVAYLAGAFQILEEVQEQIGSLTPEAVK